MNWREGYEKWLGYDPNPRVSAMEQAFRAGAEWALKELIDAVNTDENAYGLDTAIEMLKKLKEQP